VPFICLLIYKISNIKYMGSTTLSQSSDKNSGAPLISFRRVSRFYRVDRPALFDISFDIHPGEFVYIAGPSGAGKSTLLRLIFARETPDTGAVFFDGHNLASLKKGAVAALRRSMGVIFQDYLLVQELSVAANIGLPLEVLGMPRREIRRRVEEVLALVGLLGHEDEMAGGLSGGEQQRTAIARALAGKPDIVLADEPTGSLDAYNADFVLDLLENVANKNTTVVLASHDRMLMAARPHRIIALDRGRIVGMSSEGAGRTAVDTNKKISADLQQTA
jgi:cell division transport system ATP-binding protein